MRFKRERERLREGETSAVVSCEECHLCGYFYILNDKLTHRTVHFVYFLLYYLESISRIIYFFNLNNYIQTNAQNCTFCIYLG